MVRTQASSGKQSSFARKVCVLAAEASYQEFAAIWKVTKNIIGKSTDQEAASRTFWYMQPAS